MVRPLSKLFHPILLGLALAGSVCAEEPTSGSTAELNRRFETVEAILDRPFDWELDEAPLRLVLDVLRYEHGVPLRIEEEAIADEGIDLAARVTLSLKGSTLRAGLGPVLDEGTLAAVNAGDGLLVTTTTAADERHLVVVYPVDDLLTAWDGDEGFVALIGMLPEMTSGIWTISDGSDGLPVVDGRTQSLIVSQTYSVHQEVHQLFTSLRAVRGQPARAGTLIRGLGAPVWEDMKADGPPARPTVPPAILAAWPGRHPDDFLVYAPHYEYLLGEYRRRLAEQQSGPPAEPAVKRPPAAATLPWRQPLVHVPAVGAEGSR